MDYEKKYKEALEWLREGLYPATRGEMKEEMERYFPELKESEDERIRKALMQNLKERFGTKGNMGEGLDMPDVLAWLEKQGESTEINPSEFDLRLNKLLKQFESLPKEDLIGILSFYLNVIQNDGIYKEEKQGEQKPTDKVEPKFKVGKWYQCTKDFFGEVVTFDKNTAYYCAKEGCLQNKYRCHIAIFKDLYDNFKLWTIQDAKDGDVLKEDSCVFIVEKIKSEGMAIVHFCLFNDGDFELDSTLGFDVDSTYPATKEQRDLLFKKMKEAGYEWDAEKKELKKIEQKSAEWSKEDEQFKIERKAILNDVIAHLRFLASIEKNKVSLSYIQRDIDWIKENLPFLRP